MAVASGRCHVASDQWSVTIAKAVAAQEEIQLRRNLAQKKSHSARSGGFLTWQFRFGMAATRGSLLNFRVDLRSYQESEAGHVKPQ